jgi:hypothetical protein
MQNEKDKMLVGDIKIKEPKVKKASKKKRFAEDTPLGIKLFVWFMALAMFLSFAGPLTYYLISVMTQK